MSGYRLYDNDGDYILTAAHIPGENCSKGEGEIVQACNYDEIGKVVDGHALHDWVVIAPNSSGITDVGNYVWYNGYEIDIGGINPVAVLKHWSDKRMEF